MEQHSKKETPDKTQQKKDPGNKTLLIIVISAWALFYVFMGSKGGG